MKKIISLALCCVIAASAFASCAQTPVKNYSPKITVSSSEAEESARYLTNRLGDSLENSVYLALGDDSGIDLSNFENDGYVIRTDGASAVIAGKNASALSFAVRKYANEIEAGRAVVDIAYHEGYRIDEFRLAGADISEYAIEYPAEHNENMMLAVEDMKALVKKACGADLPVSEGITNRERAIEFRFTDNAELRDDGFRYFFEGKRFVIEGAVKRGCMYGVYRFLRNECGWDNLVYGNSHLQESALVDISADTDVTEVPAFDYCFPRHWRAGFVNDGRAPHNYVRGDVNYSYGYIDEAHHADHLLETNGLSQICYTDEETFYYVCDNVEEYINHLKLNGWRLGKELQALDVAQSDSGAYCACKRCLELVRRENGAISGPVIRWMNALVEEMDTRAGCEGIIYKCYAYAGSNKPCVTRPSERVYVTFCTDYSCSAHALDGKECHDDREIRIDLNDDFASWLRGWCELSDNIYVWYYALDLTLQQYTIFETFYDDMKFIQECGAKGMMIECETEGLGMLYLLAQLNVEMNWNPDMTREEYEEAIDRLLRNEFGDGWGYIREYIDIWQKSQDLVGQCWKCWSLNCLGSHIIYLKHHANDPFRYSRYDTAYIEEQFEYTTYLLEKAEDMAADEAQLKKCELFSCHMYYEGIYSSYFKAYDNNDIERLAELSRRYDLIIERMTKYGINIKNFTIFKSSISDNLEDAAWLDWADWRDELPKGETQRPMPDKYLTVD